MKSSQMSVNVSLAADDAKNHDGEGELGFDRSLLRAPADPAIVSPVDLLILVEVLLIRKNAATRRFRASGCSAKQQL